MQEAKMYVFEGIAMSEGIQGELTAGVIVPEFSDYAFTAARERLEKEYMHPIDNATQAVMLIEEEDLPEAGEGRKGDAVVAENLLVGLAVLEETSDSSAFMPDQEDGPTRLLQAVEFDDGGVESAIEHSDLVEPQHRGWGEGGFLIYRVTEDDVYSKMPMEELARRGLLKAGVEVECNSAVLILTEGAAPRAVIVDDLGEQTQVDAREMINTIVAAEMERQIEKATETPTPEKTPETPEPQENA